MSKIKTKILICLAAFFAPAVILFVSVVVVAIVTPRASTQHDALVTPTPREEKILAERAAKRAEAERRQAAQAHLDELGRDADARRDERYMERLRQWEADPYIREVAKALREP